MADTEILIPTDTPPDAMKKWIECQIQEGKSVMFKLKQQLDLCDQEIDDIRNGKIKKIQYSMIMASEKVKDLTEKLNTVSLQ